MRSFTHIETAFLAWVYGQITTARPSDRYDMTAQNLQEEWEELTGETLDADFRAFALSVHETQ